MNKDQRREDFVKQQDDMAGDLSTGKCKGDFFVNGKPVAKKNGLPLALRQGIAERDSDPANRDNLPTIAIK